MVTCAACVLWGWDIDRVLEECFDIICGNARVGLWGYDFNKAIPSFIELNKILKGGEYPRLVEWEPIEIDEQEYDEIV